MRSRALHSPPDWSDAGTAVHTPPAEVRIRDRFTEEEGEWEVVSHPATLHGAKSLRAKVQRPGQPATERDVTQPAHVRVEIRRGS
jgi:hypothetical protein